MKCQSEGKRFRNASSYNAGQTGRKHTQNCQPHWVRKVSSKWVRDNECPRPQMNKWGREGVEEGEGEGEGEGDVEGDEEEEGEEEADVVRNLLSTHSAWLRM